MYPVFKENKRCLTLIDSPRGKILQMEIGALLAGRIYNHCLASLKKGQE
ncbi:phosphatidylserine decarboxylase [Streptomyces scabiei]